MFVEVIENPDLPVGTPVLVNARWGDDDVMADVKAVVQQTSRHVRRGREFEQVLVRLDEEPAVNHSILDDPRLLFMLNPQLTLRRAE